MLSSKLFHRAFSRQTISHNKQLLLFTQRKNSLMKDILRKPLFRNENIKFFYIFVARSTKISNGAKMYIFIKTKWSLAQSESIINQTYLQNKF